MSEVLQRGIRSIWKMTPSDRVSMRSGRASAIRSGAAARVPSPALCPHRFRTRWRRRALPARPRADGGTGRGRSASANSSALARLAFMANRDCSSSLCR